MERKEERKKEGHGEGITGVAEGRAEEYNKEKGEEGRRGSDREGKTTVTWNRGEEGRGLWRGYNSRSGTTDRGI